MKKLLILSMVLGLSSYASAALSWSVTGGTGPGGSVNPGDNLTLSLDCPDDYVTEIVIDWITDGNPTGGLFTGSSVHPGFNNVISAGMSVADLDSMLTAYGYLPTGKPTDDWCWIDALSTSATPPTGSGILTLDYTFPTTPGTYTIEGGIIGPPLAGINLITEKFGGCTPLPPLIISWLEITPVIELSPLTFEFSAIEDGPNPDDQILTVLNSGEGTLNWEITETCDWLTVDPNSGSSTGEPDDVTLSVDISGLDKGEYNCQLTVSDPCAMNNPQTVPVELKVFAPGDFDEDGEVNCDDLRVLSHAWMNKSGDDNWNPDCDISDPNDEVIDGRDFGVFAMYWNGCGDPPPPAP